MDDQRRKRVADARVKLKRLFVVAGWVFFVGVILAYIAISAYPIR